VRVAHAGNYAANRVATAVIGGYVDLLRFGEGIRRGGWGWAEDGLRLLQILPIGRVSGLVGKSLRRAGRLRRVAVINELEKEGVCAWINMKQALTQTLVKHAATLEDLVEAAQGLKNTDVLGTLKLSEVAQILRNAGATVKELAGPAEELLVEHLEALVRAQKGGVVMFAMRFRRAAGKVAGQIADHCMYAYINEFGEFRIVDRVGEFKSFSELDKVYAGISFGNASSIIHIADALVIRVMDELSGAPIRTIAWEVRSVFFGNEEDLNALYWQTLEGDLRSLPYGGEPVRSSPTDNSLIWVVGGGDPLDPQKKRDELLFDSNSSKLKPEQIMVLQRAWDRIRAEPTWYRIVFNGYSDNLGNDAANKHMSLRRAEAVAKWFLDRGHLTRDFVVTQGLGATADGRNKNRVEILIYNRY
jgi:outer membrane protein OmpA-like peptidoglycan-associated protein